MKKLIALLVAVALLVSASATVFALSSTMSRKTDSGSYEETDMHSYQYYCELNASLYKANVRMTYGNNATSISCTVSARVKYYDKYQMNQDNDYNNSTVSAATNSNFNYNGLNVVGTIVHALGIFRIRSVNFATLSMN